MSGTRAALREGRQLRINDTVLDHRCCADGDLYVSEFRRLTVRCGSATRGDGVREPFRGGGAVLLVDNVCLE